MLVLLGPSFAGGDAAFQRLSKVTGMVGYDLRARLKPGAWGLLKALADETEATRLADALKAENFPCVVMAREVASDPGRPILWLKGLAIEDRQLTLHLSERSMAVPVEALCSIVRGEAQVGKGGAARAAPGSSTSSATFRAVVPSASDVQVFRESQAQSSFEAFAAADLHFHSVTWIARIDARSFDFRELGIGAESPANALDTLVDRLALLGKVRVDRALRASSVSSFTQQAARIPTPPPHQLGAAHSSHRTREISGDERFDPYSRVIGEAERLLAKQSAPSPSSTSP
jgi:hypothetical protein